MGIGFLVDDEAPLFQTHMVFGIAALFLLVIRVILGFAGSRHARFANFPLHPREIATYIRSVLIAKTKRHPGNNPGSAVAAVLMFILVPALFITGIRGGKAFEEGHELFAWGLLTVILLHLMGIVLHTIRHRENIGSAMVTGKKTGDPADAIRSAQPLLGAFLLIAVGTWIAALFANHDASSSTVKLPLIGTSIQLGEKEDGEKEHKAIKHDHDDDD
jgi:cytochrome b